MSEPRTPAWFPFHPRRDPIGELPRDHPARLDMGGTGDPGPPCSRCKRPGSLYDGEWPRPEGPICWVCVDQEPDEVTCATCHTTMPETHCCDGALGEKCPHYPLEDAT